MADIYKILQNVDDITINCIQGFEGASNLNTATLFTSNGLLTNILYNAGFMFTDILNIISYNTANTNPFWYYLSFNMGDFLVRFIYRDTTTYWKKSLNVECSYLPYKKKYTLKIIS